MYHRIFPESLFALGTLQAQQPRTVVTGVVAVFSAQNQAVFTTGGWAVSAYAVPATPASGVSAPVSATTSEASTARV